VFGIITSPSHLARRELRYSPRVWWRRRILSSLGIILLTQEATNIIPYRGLFHHGVSPDQGIVMSCHGDALHSVITVIGPISGSILLRQKRSEAHEGVVCARIEKLKFRDICRTVTAPDQCCSGDAHIFCDPTTP
jgi:hypothetical protein